jgi:hypothetical protein
MRRCIFCGRTVDVVLWVIEDVVDDPVPACRSCAEEHGLGVVCGEIEAGDTPEHDTCRCCGRELPSPRSWPMTVWVQDRRRLMAVCNACRVEYALQAVFASAPPAGGCLRREPEAPHEQPGTSPPD